MSTSRSRLSLLRTVIAVQVVAVFSASATAGAMMTVPAGHVFHSAASYTIFVVAVVQLVVAILLRRSGGPAQPIRYSAGFLAATLLQVGLGLAGLKYLHVPLGVLLFGGIVFQLAWAAAAVRAQGPATATT